MAGNIDEIKEGQYLNEAGEERVVLGWGPGHNSPEVIVLYKASFGGGLERTEWQHIGSFLSMLNSGGYRYWSDVPFGSPV